MCHLHSLTYLITFRTYGTWLPGDPRGWRRHGDGFHLPARDPSPGLHRASQALQAWPTLLLAATDADVVRRSLATTAGVRSWHLHAAAVVTNHVHVVVSAPADPVAIAGSLKAYAGRDLRAHLGLPSERPVWGKGAHWREVAGDGALAAAVAYVGAHG